MLHELFDLLQQDPKVFEDEDIDHLELYLSRLFILACIQ